MDFDDIEFELEDTTVTKTASINHEKQLGSI